MRSFVPAAHGVAIHPRPESGIAGDAPQLQGMEEIVEVGLLDAGLSGVELGELHRADAELVPGSRHRREAGPGRLPALREIAQHVGVD